MNASNSENQRFDMKGLLIPKIATPKIKNVAFEGKNPGKVHSYRIGQDNILMPFARKKVVLGSTITIDTLFANVMSFDDRLKQLKVTNDEVETELRYMDAINPVDQYIMNDNVAGIEKNAWTDLIESLSTPIRVYSMNRTILGTQVDIYFTVTLPSEKSYDGVIVYSKGNAWDLGSFHRPYRNRPFSADYDEVFENAVETSVKVSPEKREVFRTWLKSQRTSRSESLAQILADASNCAVVCYEYPGYGTSDAQNISMVAAPLYACEVVEALVGMDDKKLQELQELVKIEQKPLFMYGFSIGCAVTLQALYHLQTNERAAYDRISGAILQSAFASINNIGNARQVIPGIGIDEASFMKRAPKVYQSHVIIKKLDKRIVFIHGAQDEVCNTDITYKELYEEYKHSVDFHVVGRAHNDLPSSKEFGGVVRLAVTQLANAEFPTDRDSMLVQRIIVALNEEKNSTSNNGGGIRSKMRRTDKKKHIMGRERIVYKLSRKSYVTFKGNLVPVSDLRRKEQQHKSK